jgi:hypothetical protein
MSNRERDAIRTELKVQSFFPLLVVTFAIIALSFRFFLIVWKYSANVFLWDQWDFLTPFFRGNPGILELFTWQHGPHREGIGLLLDKLLYPATRWNARVDSFTVGACIFVAMIMALLLKRRLFGRFSYSDIAIPLLFLNLNQAEVLLGAPNPAYSGFPLLLIMLYCHALLFHNQILKYILLLLLNFLLIYTGFGLFMGPVTLLVFAVEICRSAREFTASPVLLPLGGLVVASVSLGSFFVHYRFNPAVDCFVFPAHPLWLYPTFMAIMFARFVVAGIGIRLMTTFGTAILLGVVALALFHLSGLVSRKAEKSSHWVSLVLLSYSLLFAFDSAVGRVCLGLASAQASRYVSLMIPAFVAVYFWLASLAPATKRTAGLVAFILCIIPGSLYASHQVHWFPRTKMLWAECYLHDANIEKCDAVAGFALYPGGAGRQDFKEKLEYLKQHKLSFFADQGLTPK